MRDKSYKLHPIYILTNVYTSIGSHPVMLKYEAIRLTSQIVKQTKHIEAYSLHLLLVEDGFPQDPLEGDEEDDDERVGHSCLREFDSKQQCHTKYLNQCVNVHLPCTNLAQRKFKKKLLFLNGVSNSGDDLKYRSTIAQYSIIIRIFSGLNCLMS